MLITLIAAVGKNRVIGHDGKIPWHEPTDLAFFQRITQGCPCIMGRRTFESLPALLKGRLHLVLTHHPERVNIAGGNVQVHDRPEHVLSTAVRFAENNRSPRIIVMGGGDIYQQFLPLAHEIILTSVDYDGPGDSFFPDLPVSQWCLSETLPLSPTLTVDQFRRQVPSLVDAVT